MASDEAIDRVRRVRREPPAFRRVVVARIDDLTPRLRRIVVGGAELEGLRIDEPAASVRVLLPPDSADAIVMPSWTGNQFVLPNGDRAPIRTVTPREFDAEQLELTVDIVLHEHGALTDWARSVRAGAEVAISGPGRGYQIDADATSMLMVGDETAIPAISQLLEEVPHRTRVDVHIEVADASARFDLPAHPNSRVEWHMLDASAEPGDTGADAIQRLDAVPDAVWVAGEAASVQRIRKHLYGARDVPRSRVSAHGYWKQGRSAT